MIIGIDMDSVIAELVHPIDAFHNSKYGTNIKYDDHTEYDLRNYWNCGLDEMYHRLFEFYASEEFLNTKPIEGSQSALRALSKSHELHLITARPYDIESISRNWLHKYFPDIFKKIHHTNLVSKGGKGVSVKKSQICKEMGATLMIDDHIEYVIDCADNGINSFLFPAPWNLNKTIDHKLVTVVAGWEDAVRLINTL